jgi:DNA-3-methyladenine glycosylase II
MNVNNVTVIIKYLSQTDPCLREIIRSVGDFSIKIRKDPFQSLVESIIYQQLAGSAARVIYSRFIKYYNNDNNNINSRPFFPEQILSTPNSVFRSSIGLSNKKIEYIKVIQRKLSDEEVIAQLIQVKGIGRWTAEMFLIFCLGRLDVLPVTDLGIRKAMQKTYSLSDLPKPTEMLSIAQPWKPYRTVATWYLWKSLSKFHSIG